MLVLAIFGTIMQIWHRRQRQILFLGHEPGTIASAVSIGAQTGVGSVLSGRLGTKEMEAVLSDKRFRIDKESGKIVMDGEDGFENALSPTRTEFGFVGNRV